MSSSRHTLLSTSTFHLVLLFLSTLLFSLTSAQDPRQTATPSTTTSVTSVRYLTSTVLTTLSPTQEGASPTPTTLVLTLALGSTSNNNTVSTDTNTNVTTIISSNSTYPIGTTIYPNSTVLFPNTTTLYPNGTYASLNGTQYAANGTITYDPSSTNEAWNGTQAWLPFKIKIDAAYGVAGGFLILTGIPLTVLGGKNRW
jgi:hypothetical protein